jgi:hypothetical protein
MRGWTKFLVAAVVVCAALYGVGLWLWPASYPSYTIRYRLTLDVNVEGTHHIGSGVVEAIFQTRPRFPPESGDTSAYLKGYAITVDLGERGLLIAVDGESHTRRAEFVGGGVIYGSTGYLRLPFAIWRNSRSTQFGSETEYFAAPENRTPIALNLLMLPLLVRFRDLNDRNSLEEVDPEHLDATFGPGVSLESATFQIVDDPVSPMPANWPEWLKTIDPYKDRVVTWQRGHQPFFTSLYFIGTGD